MSGILAKVIDGNLIIGKNAIYSPEYTIFINEQNIEGEIQDGWYYYKDDLDLEDFIISWDNNKSYNVGDIALYNNIIYASIEDNNNSLPNNITWIIIPDDIQSWDYSNIYSKNDIVLHEDIIWKSLIDNNTTEPGINYWKKTALYSPS